MLAVRGAAALANTSPEISPASPTRVTHPNSATRPSIPSWSELPVRGGSRAAREDHCKGPAHALSTRNTSSPSRSSSHTSDCSSSRCRDDASSSATARPDTATARPADRASCSATNCAAASKRWCGWAARCTATRYRRPLGCGHDAAECCAQARRPSGRNETARAVSDPRDCRRLSIEPAVLLRAARRCGP